MSWEYNGYTVATTWCYMGWVFTRVPESRVGLAGPGNPSVIRGCWKSSSGLYPVKIIQTKHHPRPVVIIISHIYIYLYIYSKEMYICDIGRVWAMVSEHIKHSPFQTSEQRLLSSAVQSTSCRHQLRRHLEGRWKLRINRPHGWFSQMGMGQN